MNLKKEVMTPQNKEGQELKKTNHQTLQRLVPKHSKKFFVCYLVIRVQRSFVEFEVALL
jgi:hypothetical protein